MISIRSAGIPLQMSGFLQRLTWRSDIVFPLLEVAAAVVVVVVVSTSNEIPMLVVVKAADSGVTYEIARFI